MKQTNINKRVQWVDCLDESTEITFNIDMFNNLTVSISQEFNDIPEFFTIKLTPETAIDFANNLIDAANTINNE